MIYVHSSVLLAQLFAEDHQLPAAFSDEILISSRLAEYEVWNRVHARSLASTHGELIEKLLQRLDLVELTPEVLSRALDPFPVPLRTLDALHLATFEYLRGRGHRALKLATFDARLVRAAQAMNISLY